MNEEEDDPKNVRLADFYEPPLYVDPHSLNQYASTTSYMTKKFQDSLGYSQSVCVILAAGQGSRFISDTPKVIHPFSVGGEDPVPMAALALKAALQTRSPIIVIVGHERLKVVKKLRTLVEESYPIIYLVQREQMGTGHAVYLATRAIPLSFAGNIIVTYADNPGVDASLLHQLMKQHHENITKLEDKYTALILTGSRADAGSGAAAYGRIVRETKNGGAVVDIVEKKTIVKLREDGLGKSYGDVKWTADELENIDEFNSGIVIARASKYFETLGDMLPTQTKFDPPKFEYYATDFVKGLVSKNLITEGWKIPKHIIWKLEGANTVEELAELEQKSAIRSKKSADKSET